MSLRRLFVVLVSLVALCGSAEASSHAFSSKELLQGFRDDRILAKPKAGALEKDLATGEGQRGATLFRAYKRLGNLRVLTLLKSGDVTAAVERLRSSGLYEYVEPDYLRHVHATPNDPRFTDQWSLQNTGQSGGKSGADIRAVTAWDTRSSASNVIVAILDTGVRLTHEDISPNLWTNAGDPANGADDDSDSYVDDVHGINALLGPNVTNDGNPTDEFGHGTAVASVAAGAANNSKGLAGVAWQAQIMAIKAADADGQFSVSAIVTGINYAIAHHAKVINASYGSTSYSQTEYDAIKGARDAGIVFVASAGNDGVDNQFATEYPASYLLENVVAVANTDRNDQLALSSTYGALVELAAPGTDIVCAGISNDSDYTSLTGTSLAAPHVTGTIALLAAQFPSDNYRQLINRVLRSVDPVTNLSGKVETGGRLNLQKALTSTTNRPFNDDFLTAAVLTGDTNVARGVSLGATAESGEPTHGAPGGASLWWKWTPSSSGSAVVDTAGSTFDTTVAVYTGSSLTSLTSIASNDDAGGGVTTSHASFSITSGTTYYIAVDGKSGATGVVSLSVGTVPPNDTFAAAVTLTGVNAQTTGTTRLATKETGEPTPSRSYGYPGTGHSVWYKWVAPKTAHFIVAVDTQSFNAVTAVYTGSSVSQLTKVNSDSDPMNTDFDATANTTYYIQVDTSSTSTGSFVITLLQGDFALFLGSESNTSPSHGPNNYLVGANDGYVEYLDTTGNNANTNFFQPLVGTMDVNTPAFLSDDSYILTNSGGAVHVSPTGTVLWKKTFGTSIGVASSPSVGADGTVYVHSDDGVLHAYAADGTEKWTASVPGVSYASPSIGNDGTLYLGSDDHNLYAINPSNGAIKWKFDSGDQIYSSAAIGSDGTLYFGTLGAKFYAVGSNGVQKWVYTVGDQVSSSPALASDGTIYFGSYDDKIYALTSAGALKWTVTTGDQIRASSPAVASDGSIFIGSYDNNLYQISATGTVVQKFPTGSAIRSSPLLTSDGVMLWGSADDNAYVYEPNGLTLAATPWPMHRGNPARTGRVASTTKPAIVTQPTSAAVAIGGTLTLSVSATGADPLTFQWYFNGSAIAGANQASYTITNASNANAGNYTVTISNSLGSVTSSTAVVTVATASNLGRIVNLSARAVAGGGDQTLIVGFVIGPGSGTKQLLIRGVGPTLANYSVSGYLQDPSLELFTGQTSIATNADWGTDPLVPSISQQVGAFNFVSTKDAAMVQSLASGGYTAHVTASATSGNASGVALAEFYDATQVYTSSTPRLINISARSQVGQGDNVLIVGFVIGGSTPVKVLIRGVGPTLANYGVTGLLADPQIKLTRLDGTVLQQNDNWGSSSNVSDLQTAMAQVNAFTLPADSKDAVVIATLDPGAYTAIVSGANNTTGVALAEVYEVPQ